MVDAGDVLRMFEAEGIEVAPSRVAEFLGRVDQRAMKEEIRGRYEVRIWDGASPINGVPAEEVRRRRSDLPPNGVAYLILRDRKVRVFQPHNPSEQGVVPMTRSQAEEVARAHLDRLVESEADAQVLTRARAELA